MVWWTPVKIEHISLATVDWGLMSGLRNSRCISPHFTMFDTPSPSARFVSHFTIFVNREAIEEIKLWHHVTGRRWRSYGWGELLLVLVGRSKLEGVNIWSHSILDSLAATTQIFGWRIQNICQIIVSIIDVVQNIGATSITATHLQPDQCNGDWWGQCTLVQGSSKF